VCKEVFCCVFSRDLRGRKKTIKDKTQRERERERENNNCVLLGVIVIEINQFIIITEE
jgi:hypothetical protein